MVQKQVRGQEQWGAKNHIITAAKLVMEDIRSKKYDSKYYPCKESMSKVDEALE